MSITSLIPERTIDAWTAAEILSFDPFARLWAPNPRQQRNQEPWDFASSSGRLEKLIVIENKGLYAKDGSGATCVDLDLVQLARMAWLETAYNLPAFYGLPGLPANDVAAVAHLPFSNRATLRTSPYVFGSWHRMAGAFSLLIHSPVASAIAARHRSLELEVVDYPATIGIRRFLGLAVGCFFGSDLSQGAMQPPPNAALSGSSADHAWEAAANVLSRHASPELVRERLASLATRPVDAEMQEVADVRLGQLIWAAVG
jgi:hypothetical protein